MIEIVGDYAEKNGLPHPLRIDDFLARRLVCATNAQLVAERHLIAMFRPIWNNEIGICWGISKHGDAATTRSNKRSPWDVMHPGRAWAMAESLDNKASPEDIERRIAEHFERNPPYLDTDHIVRDFLSGVFMLLEDQYGVGDIVDLGEASGVVESVGLRVTTVRDVSGTVWYVRNGEILRVGNKSQGYAVAVVDIPVAHSADVAEATELAGRVATERIAEKDLAEKVLGEVQVLGVERIATEAVHLRLTVKVAPGQQFAVQRALNAAITDAFDDAGVPRPAVFPNSQTSAQG